MFLPKQYKFLYNRRHLFTGLSLVSLFGTINTVNLPILFIIFLMLFIIFWAFSTVGAVLHAVININKKLGIQIKWRNLNDYE